jgi:hypothetical protein
MAWCSLFSNDKACACRTALLWRFCPQTTMAEHPQLLGFSDRGYNDYTPFEKEVKLDPNFLESHYYPGNFHLNAGHYSLASREYVLAIPSRPDIIAFVDKSSLLTNLTLTRIKEK